MSLRKKIAQMLIMGFSGTEINENHPAYSWLQAGLGGVLLFDYDLHTKTQGKNLLNREQIQNLTSVLNNYSTDHPLFIAIDYEGGKVDRLTKIPGCLPTITPQQQAQLSEKAFYLEAKKMAATLADLGFNLNFAPVVDLNLDQNQGIIGKLQRSFSRNSEEVSRFAKNFCKAAAEMGVATCYKHFPGHGSATGDTHEGFVDVTTTFVEDEILPYVDLARHPGLPTMVMTAHVINNQLDNTGIPATLSKTILTSLLRQKIGFNGVIISDDLQMQAISKYYALPEALEATINAGADMVIIANQLGTNTAIEAIDAVEKAVHCGKINPQRIEEAYQRIVSLKEAVFAKEKVSE